MGDTDAHVQGRLPLGGERGAGVRENGVLLLIEQALCRTYLSPGKVHGCLCFFTIIFMQVWQACVLVSVHMYAETLDVFFLSCSLPYFWKQGPSLSLELTDSAGLASQQAQESSCLYLYSAAITATPLYPAFYTSAGDLDPLSWMTSTFQTKLSPTPRFIIIFFILDMFIIYPLYLPIVLF